MGLKMCGLTRKAAVVGSLALVGQVGHFGAGGQAAAAVTLTGVANFQESNTTTSSTYTTTSTTPGTQSFPYILTREYFQTNGAYEILPFIKVKTSTYTLPAGNAISGAELGLYFTDSTYYGGSSTRSDYVDLWSVADEFVPASVNMTNYNGANAWTDGFRAGIDGWTRSGPAGRHLALLWHTAAAPVGTPSSQINNNVMEYKVLKGPGLDDYLTTQIQAGKDSYFALSNSNDSGNGLRFVASSDVSWGSFLDNRPYLFLDDAAVPEPTAGAIFLVAGGIAAGRRKRRGDSNANVHHR
jgi:hypothetical protein